MFATIITMIVYHPKPLQSFTKVNHHLSNNQIQKRNDILFNDITDNPNATNKLRLYYTQKIINHKKYLTPMKQIKLMFFKQPNDMKSNNKVTNVPGQLIN